MSNPVTSDSLFQISNRVVSLPKTLILSWLARTFPASGWISKKRKENHAGDPGFDGETNHATET